MKPSVTITAIICTTLLLVLAMSWVREATTSPNPVRDCIRNGGMYIWDGTGTRLACREAIQL